MRSGASTAHHQQAGSSSSSVIQKQLKDDWVNREYIEVISANIKKITDFLNSFDYQGRDAELNLDMAAARGKVGELVVRQAKPIISANREQANKRVRHVYKLWQRELFGLRAQYIMTWITMPQLRLAMKDQFLKNSHITDPRIIDRLVHKAQVELDNCKQGFNQAEAFENVMFHQNIEPKPTDFLSKFFAGKD